VREALLELASQGLVTFLPRKGIVVNEFTNRDIEEIFELRKAIELAAVEKIAKTATVKELARLEKNISAQRKAAKAKNLQEYMALDRSFHMIFSELTGNHRLLQIMQNVRDMVHLMGLRALAKQRGRVEEVLEEHEKVVEAVRQGDAMAARALMAHHLDRSKQAVEHTHS
jgi:DNA-binding GntR family transcriptional regulator